MRAELWRYKASESFNIVGTTDDHDHSHRRRHHHSIISSVHQFISSSSWLSQVLQRCCGKDAQCQGASCDCLSDRRKQLVETVVDDKRDVACLHLESGKARDGQVSLLMEADVEARLGVLPHLVPFEEVGSIESEVVAH